MFIKRPDPAFSTLCSSPEEAYRQALEKCCECILFDGKPYITTSGCEIYLEASGVSYWRIRRVGGRLCRVPVNHPSPSLGAMWIDDGKPVKAN